MLLRSAADGEGVPLVGGDGWDVQVDVVSGLVVEKLGSLDHKVSDLEEKEGQGSWEHPAGTLLEK